METKQELRDKINYLQGEINRLQKEAKENERKWENKVAESVREVYKSFAEREYDDWKEKNAEYVRRIVAEEISKIEFNEYHNGSECTYEAGLEIKYKGKTLGSVCTESY